MLQARCPRSLDEFADIPGVGEKKLDRYAAEFLEVIAAHAADGLQGPGDRKATLTGP
jgi:superfamily II DNA helicase RecQ